MKYASALIVGSLAWAVATSAQADVFVQTDTERNQFGFEAFNSNLGKLNRVTLDVVISQQYRDWNLIVPGSPPQSYDVQWSIDGIYALGGWSTYGASFSLPQTEIPITGAGSTTVNQFFDNFPLGESVGWFTTYAGGSASFTLGPAGFAYDILEGPARIFVTGNDMGYAGFVTDTTFQVAGDHRLVQRGGECNGFPDGDDFCGEALYTLTYFYTPAGAIPEPSTWAMMLIGFGATGFAMRRRKAKFGIA